MEVPGRTEAFDQSAFEMLAFDVSVTDANGTQVYHGGFSSDKGGIRLATHGTADGSRNAFSVDGLTFPEGSYTFRLTVNHPAEILPKGPRALRAEYLVSVFPLLAWCQGAFCLAATILVIIVWLIRSAVRRARVGEPGKCPACGYVLQGRVDKRCSECGASGDDV